MLKPIDDKESAALARFRELTSDLNQDEDVSLKFLRAREGNLEKAEEMLRKSVKWRSDKNIGQFLKWKPPPKLEKDFGYTYRFTGFTNEGTPVFWIPLGDFKSKECIENGLKEDMLHWVYHFLEEAVRFAKSLEESQVVFLLECKNLSVRQVLHRESMQILYGAFQDLEMNYPEIIRTLYVVNAPKIFSIVYKLIKPILSARTISKIQIFDDDKKVWKEALMSKMPETSIPEEIR